MFVVKSQIAFLCMAACGTLIPRGLFSLGREDVFNDVAQFLAELPGVDPALFFGPEQQTHHLAVAPSALGECMQNLDHFMFERDTNRPPAPLWRHTMLLAQGQKKGPKKSQGKLPPLLATTPMARTSRRITRRSINQAASHRRVLLPGMDEKERHRTPARIKRTTQTRIH